MQRLNHCGGLGRHESRGYRSPKADSRCSEGAVGLVRRFRGYRDPDLTFHVVLSFEQGLGRHRGRATAAATTIAEDEGHGAEAVASPFEVSVLPVEFAISPTRSLVIC